jgi:S1-C subfamily serine protease
MRWLFAALVLSTWGCHASTDGRADDLPSEAPGGDEPAEGAPEVGHASLRALAAADLSAIERALREQMRAIPAVTVEVDRLIGDDVVAHGSGVVISDDGAVLTAAHVTARSIDDPPPGRGALPLRLRVVFPDGSSREAVVVARDELHDAALLRAPGPPTPFARVASHAPRAGEWVVCAGHAGTVASDRVPTRSAGVVTDVALRWTVEEYKGTRYRELARTETFPGMLALDCPSARGMSGGPVVGLDGEVLGVVVGTGAVASSIAAIRHMLPASLRARDASAAPRAPLEARRGPEGAPSRGATLEPLFAAASAARALVELEPAAPWLPRTLAVLVDDRGLVIAPAAGLGLRAETPTSDEPLACGDVKVAGRPDARCEEILAVRGELALLRLSGLGGDGAGARLAPLDAGVPELGEIVGAVGARGLMGAGFVTGLARTPGWTAPDPPRWGCGTRRAHFMRAFPAVHVDSALAHDLGMPPAGALLVDRSGRPVAVQIASHAPAQSYAIPWSDALGRFAMWLDGERVDHERGDHEPPPRSPSAIELAAVP